MRVAVELAIFDPHILVVRTFEVVVQLTENLVVVRTHVLWHSTSYNLLVVAILLTGHSSSLKFKESRVLEEI